MTVEEEPANKTQVITTMPNGHRIATKLVDGSKMESKDALVCVASDPQTKQVGHLQ